MLLKSAFIAIFVAYVVGSLPWAVWVGYAFSGKDIRNGGSGNAGAT
ncbi:MAG: acyl-phosphate--glycerol-3-phosphate O-acyltransferase, partial [Acidobacteria bacterium CG_4_9_14_3_um_filter_49_7]